jgi:DNA ligase-1
MSFKPMLAGAADLEKLRFPLFASPKLDGVRAIVRDGVVYSRSLKPIPNQHVQERYRHLEYCDGELIVGSPMAHDVYRKTVSVVMSHDEPADDVTFHVFDHIKYPHYAWYERRECAMADLESDTSGAEFVEHFDAASLDELLRIEQAALEMGFEGVMIRACTGQYKYGRSTTKEGALLKLKRFVDAEFEVIGFEERMHNGNEAQTNELGRTKRSSHKENKTGRGDLGALIVRSAEGVVFNVGTGFDDAERARVWEKQSDYLGKLAKVKYFPVGVKDAPRHPVFLGWRSEIDA